MSTCGDVGSFIESKTLVVQTSNVGFTSEVSDYLVVHTGPDVAVNQCPPLLFIPRRTASGSPLLLYDVILPPSAWSTSGSVLCLVLPFCAPLAPCDVFYSSLCVSRLFTFVLECILCCQLSSFLFWSPSMVLLSCSPIVHIPPPSLLCSLINQFFVDSLVRNHVWQRHIYIGPLHFFLSVCLSFFLSFLFTFFLSLLCLCCLLLLLFFLLLLLFCFWVISGSCLCCHISLTFSEAAQGCPNPGIDFFFCGVF